MGLTGGGEFAKPEGTMDWREIRVSLIAAVGLCLGGLILGALIGSEISSRPAEIRASYNASAPRTNKRVQFDDSASAEMNKLVLGDIATVPFQELYTVMSSRSPAELADAAQQLKSLPAGHDKDLKIARFFKAWAHFDALGALESAVSLDPPAARGKTISTVIDGADASAAESLAKAINQFRADALPPRTQRMLLGEAATKWSEINAPAAATFLDSLPTTSGSVFADIYRIAANWAASDPPAALAWAQQHEPASSLTAGNATIGAVAGWWQKDPGAAEAYVASRVGTQSGRQLASILANQISDSDPQRAIDWASQLPDVGARRQADSAIAYQLARNDPEGAAVWAASLPDDVRSNVFNSAIGMWAQQNPTAAGEWAASLNGPIRDEAIGGYSAVIAYKDPVTALNWAASISDPGARESRTDGIVRSWMQRDPQQATAWLQSSPLSPDEKQRLLATATPPPGG